MISAALASLAWAYVLWVLFLAVMTLKHAWPMLTPFTRAAAIPAVVLAILLDIAFNVVASVIFFDPPAEWTFSQRMGRYKQGAGWRKSAAAWVCSTLLDPFDIGGHCHG